MEERAKALDTAGYNTFSLQNRGVFMDMLTDSGVNTVSDDQQATMMIMEHHKVLH